MATSRLALPAKKFEIGDLSGATPTENATAISDLHVWSAQMKCGKSTNFSIVWVQGSISMVAANKDEFLLQDSSGVAKIIISKSIAPGCSTPLQGMYALAVGELLEAEPMPIIKCIKLQDISQDTLAQEMWPVEVADIQKTIYGSAS